MAKKKNNKNKNVNKSNNKVNVQIEKNDSKFKIVTQKKAVRITIHIITVLVWVAFLIDFLTFQYSDIAYPNAILSILALATFILEWNIKNK